MAARNAARVLPEPVGAAIRTWRCAWMAGHACSCDAVAAAKVLLNQLATAGWNAARAGGILRIEPQAARGGRSPFGRGRGSRSRPLPAATLVNAGVLRSAG